MKRLYELKNIAGVKDATANMARVSQQRMAMGEDFNQLSGEDITALGFNAHGGHGCISVTSNVAPRLCSEFQAACLKGDYATALKLQDKLAPLHINLFVETSPAPIKYAMSLIGKCANTLRLPMVPAIGEGAGRGARGHGARGPDQLAPEHQHRARHQQQDQHDLAELRLVEPAIELPAEPASGDQRGKPERHQPISVGRDFAAARRARRRT